MLVVRRFRFVFVSLAVLASVGLPIWPQVRVGQTVPVEIDSARDYRGGARGGAPVWSRVLEQPGATYIAIHFVDFELARGDYVVVSDATGGQAYRLEGRGKHDAGTFWAQHVKGDTARVELYSSGPRGGRGFVIDQIAVGTVPLTPIDAEATCGVDDKQNAVCYQTTHPVEYERSRAVARLLINGVTLCTGWLVSSSSDLLTNEHCITTAVQAVNTDFEFMAEAPACRDANCELCHPGAVYSGSTFIRDNVELDYALVRVNGDPATLFGYLEIDDQPALVGDGIYIPQHPGGRAKELALFSSESADPAGRCVVSTTSATACRSNANYQDVGYLCDTESGSSGAPVVSTASHKVIALHHCADCPNRAVPMQLIRDEIAGLLGPQCSVDADCNDGLFCNGVEWCLNAVCLRGLPACGFDGICDEQTDICVDVCDRDGICEGEEDCDNCPSDCVGGVIVDSTCGNGICEIGGGEDCRNCPDDCNGRTSGPFSKRFCCGAGTGCEDPRCTKRESCTQSTLLGDAYCCGDGVCSAGEDQHNCQLECPVDGELCDGDGICENGEDCINCPTDCEGNLEGRPGSRYCCGNGTVEGPENPRFCDNNL